MIILKTFDFLHNLLMRNKKNINILTGKHCLFIANKLAYIYSKQNIATQIVTSKPSKGFERGLYIVITPNSFNELPKRYISYQLEQLKNSQWFNKKYKKQLKNGIAIWDYCKENIDYLHECGFKKVLYMPLFPYYKPLEKVNKIYDVLFYGYIAESRRKLILNELSRYFKIKIIDNMFGSELYTELRKAKIILNIHYYDNALIETTRLCEVLTETDAILISENAHNTEEVEHFNGLVDFIEGGNVNGMKDKIEQYLSDEKYYNKQVLLRRKKIKKDSGKFDNNFCYFLRSK